MLVTLLPFRDGRRLKVDDAGLLELRLPDVLERRRRLGREPACDAQLLLDEGDPRHVSNDMPRHFTPNTMQNVLVNPAA